MLVYLWFYYFPNGSCTIYFSDFNNSNCKGSQMRHDNVPVSCLIWFTQRNMVYVDSFLLLFHVTKTLNKLNGIPPKWYHSIKHTRRNSFGVHNFLVTSSIVLHLLCRGSLPSILQTKIQWVPDMIDDMRFIHRRETRWDWNPTMKDHSIIPPSIRLLVGKG